MSKNIDYYEGDFGDEQGEEIPMSAIELADMIEQKLEGGEEGRPKYWKRDTNSLIDEYNRRFGHTYKRV